MRLPLLSGREQAESDQADAAASREPLQVPCVQSGAAVKVKTEPTFWWERPPPTLSVADLAFFFKPLTWPEIKSLHPFRRPNWWRAAVLGADECGTGLLEWIKHRKAWTLSVKGREFVERERIVH